MVPDPLFVLIVTFWILSVDMLLNFTGWISSGVSVRRTLSCASLSSGCSCFNDSSYLYRSARYHVAYAYRALAGIIHISFMHKPCKFCWCFSINPRRWDSFQRGNSFKLPSTIPIFFSDDLLLVMTLMAFIAANFA